MDDETEGPENVVNLAEELVLVMANEKSDKAMLDNIIKEWEKVHSIRELFNKQSKLNIQEMANLESADSEMYKSMQMSLEQVNHEGQNLEQIITQRKEEIAVLSAECERLQQNLEECQHEVQKKEAEKLEEDMQRKISIPRAKHDVRLYKMMTNLHLEPTAQPNELKGCVCGEADVSPFSLNKSTMSKFDLVNSVWDMLKEDW